MDTAQPTIRPQGEAQRRTRPMMERDGNAARSNKNSRAAVSSALAQAVEDLARGEAVRDLPDRGLIAADGDAGCRTDEPVGRADDKAARGQQLLQLVALLQRKHA